MLPTLVVVIPALNEEKTIGSILTQIPQNIAGIGRISAVVVDDGSTDTTGEIAQKHGAAVVRHAQSMGVGAAFQDGLKKALELGADYIVNIDADGQFNPQDIPTVLQPLLDGAAEFVTVTRFAKEEYMPKMPAIKVWGNKWMVRIVNTITSKNFTDVSCGFRAYSRDAALRLTLFGRFTYTQESFIDLSFKGISMTEVPVKVRGEREFGTSRVASNLWKYAVKSASIIFRAARDYLSFYFIGVPGLIILIVGIAAGIFITVHYFATGQTYPYRSLVTGSGMLMIIGILLLFISFIADMIHRNRILIEEMLYLARKRAYAVQHDNEKKS